MIIEGISSEIEIVRSRRKTLSADIEPDGRVIVRAPMKMPLSDITRFLTEKSRLIEKHVLKRIAENEKLSETRPFTPEEIQKIRPIPPADFFFYRFSQFFQSLCLTVAQGFFRFAKIKG